MIILIIGSGGREHALAECFARSKGVEEVIVSPGNDGIAMFYDCVKLSSHQEIRDYCIKETVGLVFIGPEQPIEEGLSDYLREAGINVIAPSKFAAQLETSKVFAKELMQKWKIPTAKYLVLTSETGIESALQDFSYPLVIKADGLAAGKGVHIVYTRQETIDVLDSMLTKSTDSINTKKGVLLEEYLQGWEVSLFAISDGINYVSTVFAQDHKQVFDGDLGPNTGGMGAYAPVPEAEVFRKQIEEGIISPTLAAMRELGYPYQGILYCGLMITKEGPKVIEFNCRLGDPEAEVLLPLLENDLLEVCHAILGTNVDKLNLSFKQATALGVVMASSGYPGNYPQGLPIDFRDSFAEGIYFSGVAKNTEGLVTAGGRVMCVVGIEKDIETARKQAYEKVQGISFASQYYRTDIGLRTNIL
ncbi:MAG: phosphoribosylamine--glycine ligase [Candidatus Cloacimonetes bacterium]|nr:phosphoribosylamine--glycine ligase [Candidatus Cloacimonadota bacterium]